MNQLKKFRLELKKSRREMAEILGVSHSLYEKIELGERGISTNFLRKLKTHFPDVDINIFLS